MQAGMIKLIHRSNAQTTQTLLLFLVNARHPVQMQYTHALSLATFDTNLQCIPAFVPKPGSFLLQQLWLRPSQHELLHSSLLALQHDLVCQQQLKLAVVVRDEERCTWLLGQELKATGGEDACQVLRRPASIKSDVCSGGG